PAGRDGHGLGGGKVGTGGERRLGLWQGQAGAVREALHGDGDGSHSLSLAGRLSAIRATRRAATSVLLMVGHASTPAAVTRLMVLRSPPITPVPSETSLARIQ